MENPSSKEPDTEPQAEISRLIAEHHRAIYRYAFRLSGQVADAEDLTQQTFIIAQQKIEQIRDPAKTRAWLYTVLRNCYLKSRRRTQPVPVADLEMDIDAIPALLPTAEQIDRQALQQAVDSLPDEFKLVVVMFYFQDCSYKDIAAELEIPLGTVMSRLARAKGRLRRRLLESDDTVRDNEPTKDTVIHTKNTTEPNTAVATFFPHHLSRTPASES